ncbi:MAG: FeoB-associated Cys-rich membrane protein [Candidatus Limisoma sp.]|nr:FeoB-associated Cys-rich membrane protein [Bacteroidales bacterium]MDY4941850.1 FeoB-associated Cys-rich membrane protein [Candidatus Limisoma sp.]MDY5893717.1 FeoB-associated Cys-rich membrane protein [Candidatus Limisoma sp.]
MIWQYIIVGIVLVVAVVFAVRKLLKRKGGCNCDGCCNHHICYPKENDEQCNLK